MQNESAIQEISQGSIIILGSNVEKYFDSITKLLKEAINSKGLSCVYVTFNRPSKYLIKQFKNAGINVSKIKFVDAVTRLSEDADLEKNCVFVDSPKELSFVSSYVRNFLEAEPSQKKFVLLDSINNLANFVSINEAIAFIQTITNKLRLIEVGGSIMMVVEKSPSISGLDDIGRIADKKIILA